MLEGSSAQGCQRFCHDPLPIERRRHIAFDRDKPLVRVKRNLGAGLGGFLGRGQIARESKRHRAARLRQLQGDPASQPAACAGHQDSGRFGGRGHAPSLLRFGVTREDFVGII